MKKQQQTRGFSLVEVIVAIVVTAVAATVAIPYLNGILTRSQRPMATLRAAIDLHTAMENIVGAYTNNPAALSASVGAEGGSYQNVYGQYAVVYNRFIQFSGANAEQAATGTNLLLKVAIRNSQGETLTRLFGVP